MFATTSEQEALFARGWPHLRTLVSPHPHEADAAKWALDVLDASDPAIYGVVWPREVAIRFVRGRGVVGDFAIGAKAHLKAGRLKALPKALATAGDVSVKEARDLFRATVSAKAGGYDFQAEHFVLLLEAMIGSEALLEIAIDWFDAMPEKDWQGDGSSTMQSTAAYSLGFVLRRVPDAKRARYQARIAAIVAKRKESFTRDYLSFAVGGAAALQASGHKLGLHIVHHANDPALLVRLAREKTSYFLADIQLAYLGGEAVLEAYAPNLRKVPAWRLPWLVDELATVASPHAIKLLEALAEKKTVATKVAAALASLRTGSKKKKKKKKKPASAKKSAKKKPTAAQAETRFEELSAWLAKELGAARGSAKKERALIGEAVSRYADVRTDLELEPLEAVVHFFAADGCGFEKQRTPALLRVKPTDKELARWTTVLQELA